MNTFRMLCFLTMFLIPGIYARAQHRVVMNINYSVNIPTGSFADYIGNTSFRGWNANISYRLNEKLSIGGTTGFQDFYQKNERALYKDTEGSDISAVVTNSIQSIPLLATARYALATGGSIQPYVAAGVGANFIMHSQFLGQFANDYNKLGFAARPEVGVFIPIRKEGESGINIAGSFNYMPYSQGELKNLNSWGISVGGKFPLR